jgi:hypothetical protein
MSLAPLHLADLKNSGLTDATITEHRIESVRPHDIRRFIGFEISGLISAYRLPFPMFKDGYQRLKLFYEEGAERYPDGSKKPKYIQKKGMQNRLYIPVPVFPLLDDPAATLYVTEGEKKSLAATRAGIPCIAITGLWNWKQPGSGLDRLIPDFDRIVWRGRKVRIVPDNDWLDLDRNGKQKNLKQAVFRLCRCLQLRGADTEIVLLPDGGPSHE